MDNTALTALQYGFDTFYFLVCGALVMWMAAGFAMLESGLVRAKNTTEILTKNIALYAVASIMYLVIGYHIMYSSPEGGILPSFGFLLGDENSVESVLAGGDDALTTRRVRTSSSRWCSPRPVCRSFPVL